MLIVWESKFDEESEQLSSFSDEHSWKIHFLMQNVQIVNAYSKDVGPLEWNMPTKSDYVSQQQKACYLDL